MTYPTCKTCKFYEVADLRKHPTGFCRHEKVGGDSYEQLPDALTVDSCGNDCMLLVAPDFGCIHHEELE